MSQTIARKQRQAAYKLVLIQVVIALLIAAIGLLFSVKTAFSLLVGGLIVVLANFVFATIVFRKSGAQAALAVKKAFYLGEGVKFMLTLVLLVLAFKLLPVEPPALLIGFSIMALSQWFTPLVFKPSF